jgi:hypothetical protein
MKTQTRYEELFLNEIRSIPEPVLPQALKMLRLLKEGVLSAAKLPTAAVNSSTGFCGLWQDERTAEEIISDISSHRSGLGGRRIDTHTR